MQLKPSIDSPVYLSAMAVPSWQSATEESPPERGHPPDSSANFDEVIFPHSLDPLGELRGWLDQYTFEIPSPIVHICEDELHIGVIDLSELLGFPYSRRGLTVRNVISHISRFMAGNLSKENYDCFNDRVKRYISLAFKRRILGRTARETTPLKDWDDFLSGNWAADTQRPRHSDLFLERRSVWKFTIWPDYSILWVSGETSFVNI